MAEAACPPRCPGCSHRDRTTEESLGQKQEWLSWTLASWRDRIEPVRSVGEGRRLGYRHKTCLRAERAQAGERAWKLGLRVRAAGGAGRKPVYEVIDIPFCPVQAGEVNRIAAWVSRSVPAELPFEFLQISGALVTLVFKSARLPELRLPELPPEVKGLFLNLNPVAGQRVFSSRGWHHWAGKERATFPMGPLFGGREFQYGPQTFQQLIPELFEGALGEAAAFLGPTSQSRVLDLYSGIGISQVLWQSRGAESLGVELSGEAVECAEVNAGPGRSLRGRVEERIPQLESWLERPGETERLAFVNPPRTGLGPEVSQWLGSRVRPRRLAYLSCSAGTLARDLSILTESGYGLRRIIPYDFFPQTHHVETLAFLEREA